MNKKMLTLGVIALGVTALGVGTMYNSTKVFAQSNTPSTTTEANSEAQDPSYTGSITLDSTKYDGVNEADESKALQPLATITSDEAKAIAEKEVGGTASSVDLGDENGYLVYEVVVGNQEVKVDAGNGAILAKEAADAESEKESESEGSSEKETDGIDHQFEGQEEHED